MHYAKSKKSVRELFMEKSKNKVGNVLKSVKEHWKNPPEGRYIPYKEILSYSIGGIGVKFVLYTVSYIGLSATSLLAGAALGLKRRSCKAQSDSNSNWYVFRSASRYDN